MPSYSRVAYWRILFKLKRYSSQRDKQKGESYVHGFTFAMTAQNRFYRPISEQDTQAGYADIFLCPLLDIYSDMKHSYIVELKYAKYKDPETRPISDGFRKNNVNYWAFREIRSIIPHL